MLVVASVQFSIFSQELNVIQASHLHWIHCVSNQSGLMDENRILLL